MVLDRPFDLDQLRECSLTDLVDTVIAIGESLPPGPDPRHPFGDRGLFWFLTGAIASHPDAIGILNRAALLGAAYQPDPTDLRLTGDVARALDILRHGRIVRNDP